MSVGDGARSSREPGTIALELQKLLIGADGVESFLADASRYAAGAVAHAQSVGITVGATGCLRMLGATSDELAEALDAIQYDIDDGPCLTCLRTAQVVVVDDIAADPRWPAFARRGRQAGAGSSMSVPIMIDSDAVGALNLYSREAHGLTAEDQTRAQQFADQAAGAIALARRLEEREQIAGHLEKALTSRSVIDQALGVIIARTGTDAEHAFELLRAQSQHTNEKLREVAAQIVKQASNRAR
jgi:GAF domain-containing protein